MSPRYEAFTMPHGGVTSSCFRRCAHPKKTRSQVDLVSGCGDCRSSSVTWAGRFARSVCPCLQAPSSAWRTLSSLAGGCPCFVRGSVCSAFRGLAMLGHLARRPSCPQTSSGRRCGTITLHTGAGQGREATSGEGEDGKAPPLGSAFGQKHWLGVLAARHRVEAERPCEDQPQTKCLSRGSRRRELR